MIQHHSATARRFTAGVIAFASPLFCVMAGEAWAQAPRDVLIGVSTPREADPPAAVNQQANDLYTAASAAIRQGEIAYGQRQLELLVARFPEAEAAQRARRDLAAIYASVRVTDVKLDVQQRSNLGAAQPPMAPPPVSAWRTTVRQPLARPAAQDDLRESAGDLVFFSEGSSELGSRARKALAAQAAWLAKHPEQAITVEGHADEPGTPAELQALSQARAQAVRDRLVEEGIDAARIRVAAFAATRRALICPDLTCASQNRRAVIAVGGSERASLR